METTLHYTKTIRNCTEEKVEKTVKVPKDWGMSTPQGNQGLRKKANTLLKNILKIKNSESKDKYINYLNAFQKYFRSYERGTRSKTYSESRDTAVREQVWCFAEEVSKAVGVSYDALDDLWERR